MISLFENAGSTDPGRNRSQWPMPHPGLYDGYGGEVTGRVGPNAIIQLKSVLQERLGRTRTAKIFAASGLDRYLLQPPHEMVDEHEVARLHREVRRALPAFEARTLMTEAGDRTGRYILANRIPGPVKLLFRGLPAPLASRLLIQAIRKHSWTFAGSAAFRINRAPGGMIIARIANNPFIALDSSASAICAWHSAVFQRLFRTLVDGAATVEETGCCATGAAACRFEIRVG